MPTSGIGGLVTRRSCRSMRDTNSSVFEMLSDLHKQRVYYRTRTSGMNPPWRIPNKARVVKNDARPSNLYWQAATILQRIICIGIHRSGPNLSLFILQRVSSFPSRVYIPLRDELGRQLGAHKRQCENRVTEVVVCINGNQYGDEDKSTFVRKLTICSQIEVYQKIVGQSLCEIHAIYLKRHEGYTSEYENSNIYFTYQSLGVLSEKLSWGG